MTDALPRTTEAEPIDLASAFYDVMFGEKNTTTSELNDVETEVANRLVDLLNNSDELVSLIPPLSQILTQLSTMLREDTASISQLNELVMKDVGLSAELVKLANSPIFRRSDVPLADTETAIRTVGFRELADLVSRAILKNVVKVKHIYFKLFGQQIWNHSLACAVACKTLGGDFDRSEAYFLGLVHDIGKIVIFRCLVDAFANTKLMAKPGSKLFRELMTTYSKNLSYQASLEWGLPDRICDALDAQRNDSQEGLGLVLHEANLICEVHMLIGFNRLDECQGLEALLELGISEEKARNVFAAIDGMLDP